MMPRPLFHRMTLTARLTALYTLVSAAVLLGLGALTQAAVQNHFDDLDQSTLQDKVHLIRGLAESSANLDEFKLRLNDVMHSHHGLIVIVQGSAGLIFAMPDAPESEGLPPSHWQSVRDSVPSPGAVPETLQVVTALDPVHHDHFMSSFQRILWGYMTLSTMLSGLLGWWAARNGLSPLRAMKKRAQEVSSHKLDERMPVEAVPVELADLAHSLNEMLGRLQADFGRLSAFSSDLAHELRTPISNLLTQTQVTLAHHRTSEEYRNALASNSEELQRLARMVSDMLYLAKTENGLALPQPEAIQLRTELIALIDFYDALAEEKHLILVVNGQADALGDKLMVRRALSNLLSNAIRHSPEHGRVVIDLHANAQGVEVSVANEGEAIAPDVLPRLFDRFYRADTARRHPSSDGAGLGLAITRAIMLAHGGDVSAQSSDGLNRFVLHFPSC